MVLQKHEQRYTIAAFCQTARTAVACHAAVSKQSYGGFARIKVLGGGICTDEHIEGRKRRQATLS